MTDNLQPPDPESALVERTWTRAVGQNGKPARHGVMTEVPLTGKVVKAAWFDPKSGVVQRVDGTVRRNGAGRLVIESWAEGVRQETEVPRDANVDVVRRT